MNRYLLLQRARLFSLAILFFIELLCIEIFVFCCFLSIYAYTSSSINLPEWLHDTAGSLFKNKPTRQNEQACFQLTSCNSEAISTELTTDCFAGFEIMQKSVPSYKRSSALRVITPLCLVPTTAMTFIVTGDEIWSAQIHRPNLVAWAFPPLVGI